MLRLAADENFNAGIVRGLVRRLPELDVVRIQDAGLSGADDLAVLEWAARERRIVLTHDISTLVSFAFERVATGRPMPGVFAVRSRGPIGSTIEDLLLLAECSIGVSGKRQFHYLPPDSHQGNSMDAGFIMAAITRSPRGEGPCRRVSQRRAPRSVGLQQRRQQSAARDRH
jgi:hypothetical protein